MFLKKYNFHFSLATQITLISLLGFIIIFFVLFFNIYLQYLSEEEKKVNQKLLKYWTFISYLLSGVKMQDRAMMATIGNEYQRDIDIYTNEYALRIERNDTKMLFLYPQMWKNEGILEIDFYQDYSLISRNKLEIVRDGKVTKTQFVLYEVQQGEYNIQIIVSSEERNIFFARVLRNSIGFLLVIIVIGFVISRVIIARALRPLQRINELAEQIILEQNIDKRILVDMGGEFTRIQQNINKMLDVIERQVKSLRASTISLGHDIRTPLTHVLNYLEESLNEQNSPEIHKRIQDSIQSIINVQTIARKVLDISDIEVGISKIPHKKVHLATVLEGIVDMYSLIAEEKGVSFEYDISDECYVLIEEIRIRQLVANLLDNAVKYTEKGQSISLYVSQIKHSVSIVVSDNGYGISEDDLPYIWESTWKKRYNKNDMIYQGGGFGLSIVKGIVNVYNGKIYTRSELGKGSTFTVLFSSA